MEPYERLVLAILKSYIDDIQRGFNAPLNYAHDKLTYLDHAIDSIRELQRPLDQNSARFWCEFVGLDYETFISRVEKTIGMSLESAKKKLLEMFNSNDMPIRR